MSYWAAGPRHANPAYPRRECPPSETRQRSPPRLASRLRWHLKLLPGRTWKALDAVHEEPLSSVGYPARPQHGELRAAPIASQRRLWLSNECLSWLMIVWFAYFFFLGFSFRFGFSGACLCRFILLKRKGRAKPA